MSQTSNYHKKTYHDSLIAKLNGFEPPQPTMWATFVPRRRPGQFKVHYKKHHADAAYKLHSYCNLYRWDPYSGSWALEHQRRGK